MHVCLAALSMLLPQEANPAWLETVESVLVVGFGLLVAVLGLLAARHGHATWQFFRTRLNQWKWDGLGLTAALIAVGFTFWGFIEVTELWIGQSSLGAIDTAWEEFANRIASPTLDTVMGTITWLGSGWVAGLFLAAIAVQMYRKQAWQPLSVLLVCFGAGEALVYILKAVFARARPADGISALSASFPSGHTFTVTIMFGLLLYFLATGRLLQKMNRAIQVVVAILLIACILLVGFSRIYLRAHYFTDVAGGFILGVAWLIVGLVFTRFLLKKTQEPSPS